MSAAVVIVFLLLAIGIPLALWVAIEGETSDPTVVDRAEAERIARERGGRGSSGSESSRAGPRSDSSDLATGDRSRTATDDRREGTAPGDRREESDWGSGSDDRWGTRSDGADRDERWR